MAKTSTETNRTDSKNPLTKPGVTGFQQEYNQEHGPRQDLNPDAVSSDSVLPEAQPVKNVQPSRKGARSTAVAPMGIDAAQTVRRGGRKAAAKK